MLHVYKHVLENKKKYSLGESEENTNMGTQLSTSFYKKA